MATENKREEIHKTIISIPISPVMTDDEVKKVVEVINDWI